MLLPDRLIRQAIIRGSIDVEPFDDELVQPASLDIRLGDELLGYESWAHPIDPLEPAGEDDFIRHPATGGGSFGEYLLKPGEFLLGCTLERFRIGRGIAARIEGKSSLARIGLIVHSTAGWVDPGFEGQLTLEMTNLNKRAIILRPGMRIAQLSFQSLPAPAMVYGEAGLGSHYQGQAGPTPAAPLS